MRLTRTALPAFPAAAATTATAAAMLAPAPAAAHGFALIGPGDLWAAWTFDPIVVLPLLLVHWLYGRGVLQLWRRAGFGRGVPGWRVAAFLCGEAALVLALVWPFDALGETLFSAHMIQHMLLTVVVPPLLILGTPLAPMLWALPPGLRERVAALPRHRTVRRPLGLLTRPAVATALQTMALWTWHAPAAFEAARFDDLVHTLEHASFFGTALLFWWALIHARRRGPAGCPVAAFWALIAIVTGGLLGALITFAQRQLYPSYGDAATLWGIDALADQQLAGLIMWIPAGLVHLVAGIVLLGVWLRRLERETARPASPSTESEDGAEHI